jgi:hypothetical protein
MTAKTPVFGEDILVSNGIASTASAAALRRVRALAASAPNRKVFAAIATLTELSSRAESCLESGAAALAADDGESAALELARATILMDRLHAEASADDDVAPPSYLRRRQSE